MHKSFHKNVKYQCGEETCLLKADSKHEIEQHQKESGHSVITVVESMDNYVSYCSYPPQIYVSFDIRFILSVKKVFYLMKNQLASYSRSSFETI